MNKRAVSFVIQLASPSILHGSVHFIGKGIIAPPKDRDTELYTCQVNSTLGLLSFSINLDPPSLSHVIT